MQANHEYMPERSLEARVNRDKIEDVQDGRSERAKELDRQLDAQITTDVDQWAEDPDSYDFPGVDTGPTFREAQEDDFDTGSFIDNIF